MSVPSLSFPPPNIDHNFRRRQCRDDFGTFIPNPMVTDGQDQTIKGGRVAAFLDVPTREPGPFASRTDHADIRTIESCQRLLGDKEIQRMVMGEDHIGAAFGSRADHRLGHGNGLCFYIWGQAGQFARPCINDMDL